MIETSQLSIKNFSRAKYITSEDFNFYMEHGSPGVEGFSKNSIAINADQVSISITPDTNQDYLYSLRGHSNCYLKGINMRYKNMFVRIHNIYNTIHVSYKIITNDIVQTVHLLFEVEEMQRQISINLKDLIKADPCDYALYTDITNISNGEFSQYHCVELLSTDQNVLIEKKNNTLYLCYHEQIIKISEPIYKKCSTRIKLPKDMVIDIGSEYFEAHGDKIHMLYSNQLLLPSRGCAFGTGYEKLLSKGCDTKDLVNGDIIPLYYESEDAFKKRCGIQNIYSNTIKMPMPDITRKSLEKYKRNPEVVKPQNNILYNDTQNTSIMTDAKIQELLSIKMTEKQNQQIMTDMETQELLDTIRARYVISEDTENQILAFLKYIFFFIINNTNQNTINK